MSGDLKPRIVFALTCVVLCIAVVHRARSDDDTHSLSAAYLGCIWNAEDLGQDLVISPDGKLAAAIDRGWNPSAKIWRLDRGSKQCVLDEQVTDNWDFRRRAAGLSFAPDSKSLAIADFSGDVLIYDAATVRLSKLIKTSVHSTSVVYSPDGRQLALGGADGTIHILDVASGDISLVSAGDAPRVVGLRFLASGEALAWSTIASGVHVLNLTTREDVATRMDALAWSVSDDGKWIVDYRGRLWPTGGQKPTSPDMEPEPGFIAFISPGNYMLRFSEVSCQILDGADVLNSDLIRPPAIPVGFEADVVSPGKPTKIVGLDPVRKLVAVLIDTGTVRLWALPPLLGDKW